jgi:hypothetical protein
MPKTTEDFHYKYGGSTAGRTVHCEGWAALADTFPKQGSSSVADRGTMLHECCEILEREGISYEELLKRKITCGEWTLTEELLDTKVIPAMLELEKLIDFYDISDVQTEEMLNINDLIGGTIDISGRSIKDFFITLFLTCDFKFGEGIMVYAEDNEQLLFYCWLKLMNLDLVKSLDPDMTVVLAIIQPADRREEYLDVWETTIGNVMRFGEKFMKAVLVAESCKPGEHLNTGSHCKFCPCAAGCPKKLSEAKGALDLLDTSVLKKLSTTDMNDLAVKSAFNMMDLGTALKLAARLEPWIKEVRAFAISQLALGAEDIGYKMVQKRATRQYVDVESVTKYLKRKLGAGVAMERKIISPAQADLAAKRKGVKLNMKDRVVTASSGTTLVPDSDKREAVLSQKGIASTLKLLEKNDD